MSDLAGALGLGWRPNFSRQSLLDALPLVAICLIPVLLYLPFLAAPFERDEGVYATVAQGLLDGRVPYRDLFDNKPPLVYGWYAFSFILFGEHVVAPRLIASLLLSLTTLSLFGQARMIFPRGVAYLAAGLFALSTGLPFVALHANTEAYMLLPLVTSLAAFTVGLRNSRLRPEGWASARWFLLAGALGGLAMMTKQVAVWNLLALAAVSTWWRWRLGDTGWRMGQPALSLLVGAAVTTAVVAAPFAANGALGDLLYANVLYNWLYVQVPTYGQRLANVANGTLFFVVLAAPLVAAAVAGLFTVMRTKGRPVYIVLIVWAVASVVGVASGGRFFPHYFLQLLPAMAVLAALVIYDRFTNRDIRRIGKPALALALSLVAISLATNAILYLAPGPAEKRVAESVYQQKEWEGSSQALGAYIAERTGPEDSIFNFGREAQIYFYAERRPAVRYFADWPFWWDESTLYETMEALRETKPLYIIDSIQLPLFAEEFERYHPRVFMDFLSENYDYVGKVYFADVYRLKGSGAAPAAPQLWQAFGSPGVAALEFDPLVSQDDPLQ